MHPDLRQAFSAVNSGDPARVEPLLASLNVNEGQGEHTLLHAAAEAGHAPIIQVLLRYQAQVDSTDTNGMTPLQVAIERGHMNAFRLLVEAGASLEWTDKTGARPLHWAAQAQQEDMARELLSRGVDVAPTAKFDSIPLHLATRVGSIPLIRILLQHQSPIDAATKGHTALHLASMKGMTSVVQVLLESGASMEVRNNRGCTPLHMAASTGRDDTVRLLLEHAANPSDVDAEGMTPLAMAQAKGYQELVSLFQSASSAPPPLEDQALVIFPFRAEIFRDSFHNGDLTLTPGSVITGIQKHESGWWEGQCGSQKGSFPSNYVTQTPTARARCTHDYYASGRDELTIKEGEDLILFERRPSGWIWALREGGNHGGLVPPTHIKEVRSLPPPSKSVSSSTARQASPPSQTPEPSQTPAARSSSARQAVSYASPDVQAQMQAISSAVLKVGLRTPEMGPPSGLGQPANTPPPQVSGPPPTPLTSGPPPRGNPRANPRGGVRGAPATRTASAPPKSSVRQPPPVNAPPALPKAKAIYPYAKQHSGDLELTPGMIIELTKTEGGWWEGSANGQTGIFPANYVERL